MRPLNKRLHKLLTALGLSAAALLLLDAGCPIRHITGIPCPGCGMTRACLAALRLDFGEAFRMHPLWPLPLPLILLQVFRPGPLFRNPRAENGFWWSMLALVMAEYAVRMVRLFPHTPPMDFNDGALICRIWRFFGGS